MVFLCVLPECIKANRFGFNQIQLNRVHFYQLSTVLCEQECKLGPTSNLNINCTHDN